MQNEHAVHAQKIGSGQRSRFLVVTKKIVASVDENISGRGHAQDIESQQSVTAFLFLLHAHYFVFYK